MTDEKKIITDDDWKEQAQREKEELSEKLDDASADSASDGAPGELPAPTLLNHAAMLSSQVLMAMGLVPNPYTNKAEMDPAQARYLIDILCMLRDKTEGHRDKEEEEYFKRAIPELQMTFVEVLRMAAQTAPDEEAAAAPTE